MSMTQLRAFHLVAEAGGFSQAARESSVGQSTLSAQVRQLEAGCGFNLFERQQRGAALTPEGQALHAMTTRLFSVEAEARAFLRGETGVSGGHIRIAADGPYHAIPVVAAMQRARPGLTFSLAIDNSDRVIAQLVDYRADVGITARTQTDPRLHARPMLEMAVGVFVPVDHPWAGRGAVKITELAGQPVVLRERGSVTRDTFERGIAEHGVALGPIIEISTREGVREAVAAGLGIGVVADREFGHDTRHAYLSLADARLPIHEYAICLAERRHLPLVRAFFAEAVKPQG